MAKKTTKKKIRRSQVDKGEAAERVRKIYPILTKLYPNATVALRFGNSLELLIATILSAQCTDARVNEVAPGLFKKYKDARRWADAELSEIESDIRTTGFFRNKAKSIKAASQKILSDYDGVVPDTMEELVKLPGVGRKTANCVLANAFGKPGLMCDTHVIRLSRRLGLSANTHDAVKLEFDLAEIVPKKWWTVFSHVLILHGRNVCRARKPECESCAISKHCPAAGRAALW